MTIYTVKMCRREEPLDEPDRLPSKDRVTNWDIAGFVISIISHLVDIGFDINLAYQYYRTDELVYFFTTLCLILIPALINTVFSIRMYVLDQEANKRSMTLTKRFTKRTILLVFVLLFQLAPVLRYFDALWYAILSKRAEKHKDVENQRKYYELMVKEDSDVALLRVLECFLEAAPQQTLQLAIIFNSHGKNMGENLTLVHQVLSIGSSFVSMGWSMASYQRLLRVAMKTKNNISWPGTIVQFLWHFLVTVSRILCISVIAPISPKWTICAIILHWLLMTAWLSSSAQENNFCDHHKFYDFLFYSIFGSVYIFTYVALTDGRTLCKYIFFYTVLFVENTIANVTWIVMDNSEPKREYFYPIVFLNVLPFVLGIMCMILYYKVFHPTTGYKYNFRQRVVSS